MTRLLVIDDDEASCRLVRAIFKSDGFEVLFAHDGVSGLKRAATDDPDLLILDLELPRLDGLEVLERLKRSKPGLPIVMLTGRAEVKTAVRATQLGAFDYLTKPVDPDDLIAMVRRALEVRALRNEVLELRRQASGGTALREQMGPSAAVEEIVEQVATVAATRSSVLILGETGTGKEVVARAIHRQGDRPGEPFIALDCGAIPEPLLESELFGPERGALPGALKRKAGQLTLAEGGTLFLDEIGSLPLALQAKLLGLLEARQMHSHGAAKSLAIAVRFVAATNDDLEPRVTAKQFRADLYLRLAQSTISLPPLRARGGDIAHLARRFLAEASVDLRRPVQEIAKDAMALLERQAWPGNVRELRDVIRRSVLESKELVLKRAVVEKALGTEARAPAGKTEGLDGRSLREVAAAAARDAERKAIQSTLRLTRGNKSRAARALRTDYKTLHLKMKGLGIRARDFTV
jgi:DNA-binding NtrC family response regulator